MNRAAASFGRRPHCWPGARNKPFVIAAFLGHQTLGNFLTYAMVIASFARAIPDSRLVVFFRDDRPYKDLVTRCMPFVSRVVKISEDNDRMIPFDWFDGQTDGPSRPFDPSWYAEGLHRPDLVLVPSMCDIMRTLPPAPRFTVPDELEPDLRRALIERGVDPERWFVCLHVREPGYKYRFSPGDPRCADPLTYVPAIRHIIQEQGGQVIRLGDPSMTPLPQMDDLIDLSRFEGVFPDQLFALSRARFLLGTDTGPTQMACAFKTPVACTNAPGLAMWNDHDLLLTKTYLRPDGTRLSFAEMHEMGSLSVHRTWPSAMEVRDNTPEELVAVTKHMLGATAECTGWREVMAEPPYDPPGSLAVPVPWRHLIDMCQLTVWK